MSEAPKNPEPAKTSTGLQENVESLLCYFWIIGLVFLLIEKNSKIVKFHAIQSLGIAIVFLILTIIPIIGWFLWIAELAIMIYMMVNAYNGKLIKLPVIGNFAAKQAGI